MERFLRILDAVAVAIVTLVVILAIIFIATSAQALWPAKRVMDKIGRDVQKVTGILGIESTGNNKNMEYMPFCSGALAQLPDKTTRFITAAHCCAPLHLTQEVPIIYIDNKRMVGYKVEATDLDTNGNDVCAIRMKAKTNSPVKLGELKRNDVGFLGVERYLLFSTKFTTAPMAKQVTPVYYLSLWEEDPTEALVSAEFWAGTSGSPILNPEGDIVGVVSIGLVEALFPTQGIALVEGTSWMTGLEGTIDNVTKQMSRFRDTGTVSILLPGPIINILLREVNNVY